MGDLEEQDDELLALESIYDTTVLTTIKEGQDKGGHFAACIQLPDPFIIQSGPISRDEPYQHSVQFLPPVVLNFLLPFSYPSTSPPTFTLTCKWLTLKQLHQLCQHLDQLWEENKGSVILFTWMTFLKEELFEFLELSSPLDIQNAVDKKLAKSEADGQDPRCFQDIGSQELLLGAILSHDRQKKCDIFEKSMFLCSVCFMEKQGTQCMSFVECDHVFCKDCMSEYFVVRIDEGSVQSLICPHDKCESEALPSQVKSLVSEDKFKRYDELLLKSTLDTMMDIVYCPRKHCMCPVLLDKDSNIGRCPSCQFVFCRLCKLVYHGVAPCKIKADELEKLRQEYENADEEGKQFLEKKFGKRIIKQALEESITKVWLENYTKPCPSCGAYIQKADGCNKMTCMHCRNYFCWLCGDSLSRSNPYNHFNAAGPCQGQLFQGMEMDEQFEFDGEDFGWLDD